MKDVGIDMNNASTNEKGQRKWRSISIRPARGGISPSPSTFPKRAAGSRAREETSLSRSPMGTTAPRRRKRRWRPGPREKVSSARCLLWTASKNWPWPPARCPRPFASAWSAMRTRPCCCTGAWPRISGTNGCCPRRTAGPPGPRSSTTRPPGRLSPRREGLQFLELNFPKPTEGPGLRGMQFILCQPQDNAFLKRDGKDLYLPLFEQQADSRLARSARARDLAEQIVGAEKGASSWTLMHRFNLCHDLLGEAEQDPEALALLFVWLSLQQYPPARLAAALQHRTARTEPRPGPAHAHGWPASFGRMKAEG